MAEPEVETRAEEIFIQEYALTGKYIECVQKWRDAMGLPKGNITIPPEDTYRRAMEERQKVLELDLEKNKQTIYGTVEKAAGVMQKFLDLGVSGRQHALKAAIWVLEFVYRDKAVPGSVNVNVVQGGGEEGLNDSELVQRAKSIIEVAGQVAKPK